MCALSWIQTKSVAFFNHKWFRYLSYNTNKFRVFSWTQPVVNSFFEHWTCNHLDFLEHNQFPFRSLNTTSLVSFEWCWFLSVSTKHSSCLSLNTTGLRVFLWTHTIVISLVKYRQYVCLSLNKVCFPPSVETTHRWRPQYRKLDGGWSDTHRFVIKPQFYRLN